MSPGLLVCFAIFAPVVTGLLGMALPRRAVLPRVLLALLGAGGATALLGVYAGRYGTSAGPVGGYWMPEFRLDLFFNVDAFGLFFALLVAGVGVLIVLYARAYFGPDADSLYRFYPSLLLFMTAMLGLVLSDNLMLMLLFWEMTSISSFLLIGWERDDPAAVKKALQAFIVTGAGGLALMAGLILLGVHTGAWSFSGLAATDLSPDALTTAAFAMIFAGAAAKSAQWPLHFWLPGAMAAPTPVSAYLHSATMVKAGVYLIGRLWPTLADVLPLWPALLVPIGAFTMLLGAYVALRKSDLKQIFAYTTVSQLGLLMCAYGLSAFEYKGEANLIRDVTQILNHALYKAPLFIVAGAVAHVVHTRELPELRGLFWRGGTERILAIILVLAAYAMAALPLTLSFPAKEFFLYGIYHAYEATHHPAFFALMAAAVLAGAFNVAIFVRITRVVIGGRRVVERTHVDRTADHTPYPQYTNEDRPDHAHHGGGGNAHGHDAHAHGAHGLDAHSHGGHGHGDHPHETGFWPMLLWLPALLLVSLQYLGGIAPGAFEALFGGVERHPGYFDHLPSFLYLVTHPGVPLYLSLAAVAIGLALGFAPVLTRTVGDVHDRLFPLFYDLSTKGGGRVFSLLQTGNFRTYIVLFMLALVFLIAWGVFATGRGAPELLAWPENVRVEPPGQLLPGYLLSVLVCAAAILMPLVRERASRILVLGFVGFGVAALFYYYNAPDLALTQISIEIVSLVLFLLVLSLLPRTEMARTHRTAPRLAIAVAVGLAMFWVTLAASTADRPVMPYLTSDGDPFDHLGEFFLRNSYKAVDLPAEVHIGGGGNNVVNVILVDFRGFDTLGEIAVLGLAALGVWSLLRRRSRRQDTRAVQRNLAEPTENSPAGPQPEPEPFVPEPVDRRAVSP